MSWNNLSMKDKASYIRMGVENGITDLDTIREVYNKFAEGGSLNVNDNPEKRIYDHNKGIYYVEGQDTPNNLKYSLDEFTQEQINEINSKYNKGWKTDKKGNVVFNKYTGAPLNADLKKSFANKEAYEHYTQKEPTPVGTKFKSNPSIVKAENMFKTVVGAMQRDSISARQANQGLDNIRDEINTDRVLDYLGLDLHYNRGATKVMYDGAYQLPSVTVTPNGNYTELIPNELGTGWMYKDRAGRFDDVDYSYVDKYLGNKKALGGNLFANGGNKPRYRSSSNIRKQISTWEGATMKTNTPFDEMDTMFNQVLPEGALDKLSQEQLDGLYSFAYNVGTGRFKTRTAPTLAKYLQGNATIEDVKNTIWASGDKKYRGLANRRKKERSMLGDYVPVQKTISMTTPLDTTPAVQPIIKSNPVIQDNIETFPLAFNIESQKEPDYTPGFLNYVNYINQIRQPKQRDRRIWLTT